MKRYKIIIAYIVCAFCLSITTQAQTKKVIYEYDNLNRLTKVTYSNGVEITYTYDVMGNRTQKQVIVHQWLGLLSENWHDPNNWSTGVIPDASTSVSILAGAPHMPLVTGSAVVKDLTIHSGATVTLADNSNFSMHGHLENQGTFVPNESTVIFEGSLQQVIVGDADFYNLHLNNTKNLSLEDALNIQVAQELNFLSGKFILEEGNLHIGDNASIVGYNENSYIQTEGTGALYQKVGNTDVVFPVGTRENYNPATLNNIGTVDTFKVSVREGILTEGYTGSPIGAYHIDKTWFIEEENIGFSDLTLTLQWHSNDELTGFNNSHNSVLHWHSSNWNFGTFSTATDLGNGYYSQNITGVNSFSPFSVGDPTNIALSQYIIYFSGEQEGNTNKLFWAFANSQNIAKYILQKSSNAQDFQSIYEKEMTEQIVPEYQFLDKQSSLERDYYRLEIHTKEGKIEYSEIITIDRDFEKLVKIYPNPTQGSVFIELPPLSENIQVNLFDVKGKIVYQESIGGLGDNRILELNLNQQDNGSYILKIILGNTIINRKVVLKR